LLRLIETMNLELYALLLLALLMDNLVDEIQ